MPNNSARTGEAPEGLPNESGMAFVKRLLLDKTILVLAILFGRETCYPATGWLSNRFRLTESSLASWQRHATLTRPLHLQHRCPLAFDKNVPHPGNQEFAHFAAKQPAHP